MKMRIKTIEYGEGTKADYIVFMHNGMECQYSARLLDYPSDMMRVAEELRRFCKVFFDNGAVDWRDCMDEDEQVVEFFADMHFIEAEDEELRKKVDAYRSGEVSQ
jgi:hypothetical protein